MASGDGGSREKRWAVANVWAKGDGGLAPGREEVFQKIGRNGSWLRRSSAHGLAIAMWAERTHSCHSLAGLLTILFVQCVQKSCSHAGGTCALLPACPSHPKPSSSQPAPERYPFLLQPGAGPLGAPAGLIADGAGM